MLLGSRGMMDQWFSTPLTHCSRTAIPSTPQSPVFTTATLLAPSKSSASRTHACRRELPQDKKLHIVKCLSSPHQRAPFVFYVGASEGVVDDTGYSGNTVYKGR